VGRLDQLGSIRVDTDFILPGKYDLKSNGLLKGRDHHTTKQLYAGQSYMADQACIALAISTDGQFMEFQAPNFAGLLFQGQVLF
jgi:hypothetical protein